MDIRTIKETPEEVSNGLFLEKIFELQKRLMEGYIGKIEKNLPMYPISINSEQGQVVLKDFSARVIEETAEGYESTEEAIKIAESVGWNIDLLNSDQFEMIINHLQNSNEEQADAFAFFTELFIYASIGPSDIYAYINQRILKETDDSIENLDDLFKFGAFVLQNEGYVEPMLQLFNLVTKDMLENHGKDVRHVLSYIPGFRSTTRELHSTEDHILWKVCYHLNIGRNFLKNKTWKQTQELTDGLRYQEQIVKAFIYYCGYLKVMGFTPETFYVLFFKKHKVNCFRQASNY